MFTFADKGTIAIDWVDVIPEKHPKTKQKPILMILPGLGGDNNNIYVVGSAWEGLKRGYQSVVINYRGASGTTLSVLLY